MGRPVTQADSDEGIYLDEEGNVFQLAEKGRSKPMEIEQVALEREPAGADTQTSAWDRAPKEGKAEEAPSDNHRGKVKQGRAPNRKAKRRSDRAESANGLGGLRLRSTSLMRMPHDRLPAHCSPIFSSACRCPTDCRGGFCQRGQRLFPAPSGRQGHSHLRRSARPAFLRSSARSNGGFWVPRSVLSGFVDSILTSQGRRLKTDTVTNLSRREQEVLDSLLENLSNKEIASKLNIAERTVRSHVSNLLNKFGVRRRADLILLTFQRRMSQA